MDPTGTLTGGKLLVKGYILLVHLKLVHFYQSAEIEQARNLSDARMTRQISGVMPS
jgi:hypothetical protein